MRDIIFPNQKNIILGNRVAICQQEVTVSGSRQISVALASP